MNLKIKMTYAQNYRKSIINRQNITAKNLSLFVYSTSAHKKIQSTIYLEY